MKSPLTDRLWNGNNDRRPIVETLMESRRIRKEYASRSELHKELIFFTKFGPLYSMYLFPFIIYAVV